MKISVQKKVVAKGKKGKKFIYTEMTSKKSKFGKKSPKNLAIKKSLKKHDVKNQPDKPSKLGKKRPKNFAINKSRKKHIVKNQSDDNPTSDSNKNEEMPADSSDEGEEEYEKVPRIIKSVKVRNLLPVKNKKGFLYRTEVINEEIEEETTTQTVPPEEAESKRKDLVQSYAMQRKCFEELKCKVALLCTSIIEEPDHNMVALKELVRMLQIPTTRMIISEKKTLSLSLLYVFLDVLPGYRIKNQEDTDTKVKLKKQTKKLLGYEQTLLKCYKNYLELLNDLIRDMTHKLSMNNITETKQQAAYEIGIVAVKCMCELLSKRFSFNYFKYLANKLVPLSIDMDEKISGMCYKAFKELFIADKLGDASYNLVKQIVDVIKLREFNVPANLLRTFLSLHLREAKKENKKIDMRKGREEWCGMSRTQRYYKKKYKALEAELKEAQAYECIENIKKFHTSTINKIFWVFFHILKDGKNLSLIGPALEGLSRFAYLINLEFFDDLNAVLCRMMESGKLSDVNKLHGVYMLFTILAGQAQALNIDPHQIYCHMYQGLLNLSPFTDIKHLELTIKCLQFNIIRKKNHISFVRVLAFMKRVGTMSLQTAVHATLGLLSSLRRLIMIVKGSDILLDSESSIGSGIFLPEIEDPEHCNPQSTALWELHLLKKHYNPTIKLYAAHILHNCSNEGRSYLPDKLAKLQPEETLHLFSDVAVKNEMDFLEDNTEPPKKKFKSNSSTTQICYEYNTDIELNWKTLNDVDFFTNN